MENREGLTRSNFDRMRPVFDRLREEVVFILDRALANADIKFHSLTYRIKSYESLMEKALGQELKNPLREVRDIVGVRVVCLFLSDIERVARVVEGSFDVIEKDNKIEGG